MLDPIPFTLDPSLIVTMEGVYLGRMRRGSTCFIVKSQQVEVLLRRRFGRPNLCLKVFDEKTGAQREIRHPNNYLWAMEVSLTESTKVQNLFAFKGLAPRIYAIVLINERYLAQVTDFIEPNENPLDLESMESLMSDHSIGTKRQFGPYGFDGHQWNHVGDKIVDFGGFCFHNPEEYRKKLIERSCIWMRRGKMLREPKAYQSIEELGLNGLRGPTADRIKLMRLDEIDFRGKTVLDLGCNMGAFCRETSRRGAKRAIGVDMPFIAEVARELANWMGFWNLDFLGLRLPDERIQISKRSGIKTFDIVFVLSLIGHIGGYKTWYSDFCRDIFFLEAHAKDKEEMFSEKLKQDFSKVDFLGFTKDSGFRPVFLCHK